MSTDAILGSKRLRHPTASARANDRLVVCSRLTGPRSRSESGARSGSSKRLEEPHAHFSWQPHLDILVHDHLVEPLGDVGDQVCPAGCVGEEVVGDLVVRALVVGDGAGDGVVEVGALDELLGGVDLCLLDERVVLQQRPQQRFEERDLLRLR